MFSKIVYYICMSVLRYEWQKILIIFEREREREIERERERERERELCISGGLIERHRDRHKLV